jgi:hypothetical protein
MRVPGLRKAGMLAPFLLFCCFVAFVVRCFVRAFSDSPPHHTAHARFLSVSRQGRCGGAAGCLLSCFGRGLQRNERAVYTGRAQNKQRRPTSKRELLAREIRAQLGPNWRCMLLSKGGACMFVHARCRHLASSALHLALHI